MKILIIICIGLAVVGGALCFWSYKNGEGHWKENREEHCVLLNAIEKTFEECKKAREASEANGKKLDILLNIATNRFDNL